MYIGHYGFAFYLKKKANKQKSKINEIPLWLIFISVQLIDFLCFIFILLEIERMKFLSIQILGYEHISNISPIHIPYL